MFRTKQLLPLEREYLGIARYATLAMKYMNEPSEAEGADGGAGVRARVRTAAIVQDLPPIRHLLSSLFSLAHRPTAAAPLHWGLPLLCRRWCSLSKPRAGVDGLWRLCCGAVVGGPFAGGRPSVFQRSPSLLVRWGDAWGCSGGRAAVWASSGRGQLQ